MTSVSTYVDGGGPNRKNKFHCRILPFWTRSDMFFFVHIWNSGQKLQQKTSSSFFQSRPLTPSVYLGRHIIHVIKWVDQAFPLCFCKLQAIKIEARRHSLESSQALGHASQIYCFWSAPTSFETCHLNCHYHLPNHDTPTFTGCMSSVYSVH